MKRIVPRKSRVGTGELHEPEAIQALEERRARHARAIQGPPKRSFDTVLEAKRSDDDEENSEEEAAAHESESKSADDPKEDPKKAKVIIRPGVSLGQEELASSRPRRIIVKG